MNPANFYTDVADVNCDSRIDINDALFVARRVAAIITVFPCQTATPTIPPTLTPTPTSTGSVLLLGRFDLSDPAGPKASWSASTIKARFTGTAVQANIKSAGDNWFNVVIDGVVKTPVNIKQNTAMPITLASGLAAGTVHTIELVKRTECNQNEFQFLGFTFTGGSLQAPPSVAARRIEFIGDSITCGYGNEGTDRYQSFTTKNENVYLAYGCITARNLNADQFTIAWSGKGVYHNYGGDTTDLFPAVYPRMYPWAATPTWDYTKWTPQVVVINLGTNDYSTSIPDKAGFVAAYSNFLRKIRNQYPNALIYCALGPMLNGNGLSACRDGINTAMNQLADARIKFIEFPQQQESNGYGEDWHPSLITHQLMANQLTQQIKTDMNW
jgi:lysophospholipase L1-like esterase